jgi:hypothetical protein
MPIFWYRVCNFSGITTTLWKALVPIVVFFLRVCLVHENFLALATVALFVCICQLMSNLGLIRLKRFVSWFSTKLCN